MSIKIFVPRDEQNRELPAAKSHEAWGALDLIQRLWPTYYEQPMPMAIAVNAQNPQADLLLVTERGIGIVELKDEPGIITQTASGAWKRNFQGSQKIIGAGRKRGNPRVNPHEQVRDYAEIIRERCLKQLSQWTGRDAKKFQFNTAVCFTHPTAVIDALRKNYDPTFYESWERFRVIKPEEFVKWSYTLSLADEKRVANEFKRTLLNEEQVFSLPTHLFDVMESLEIPQTMREPTAYVTILVEGLPNRSYALYPGINTIGRDPILKIPIPLNYANVSRKHARILHDGRGPFLEDVGSTHGTFLNGQQLQPEQPRPLQDHDVITLCSPVADNEFGCVLQFSHQLPTIPPTAL